MAKRPININIKSLIEQTNVIFTDDVKLDKFQSEFQKKLLEVLNSIPDQPDRPVITEVNIFELPSITYNSNDPASVLELIKAVISEGNEDTYVTGVLGRVKINVSSNS